MEEENHENHSIHIQDKQKLHLCYMPFIENGGLFISTDKTYQLQNNIRLKLQLLADPPLILTCKVIWLNPKKTSLSPGIGVQFCDQNAEQVHSKIKKLLIDFPDSNTLTQTM